MQGLRFRASSWRQLISGGVSFDTPDSALASPASAAGSEFRLYDNQDDAGQDPRGPTLVYRVQFRGAAAGGVGPGTVVQLLGFGVGQVTAARLQYRRRHAVDAHDASRCRSIRAGSRSCIAHKEAVADLAAAFGARLEKLVAQGLRAHVTSANFLTGVKVISLDMVRDAPPARVAQVDGYAQLPSGTSTDLADILASVKSVLRRIDTVTADPALGHAVKELDRTLTNLDRLTTDIEPQIKPLLDSLRETSEAAQRTIQAADHMLGTSASGGTDLPRLIRELTEAARSIRALTDYLDQHPEALIRGRRGDDQ